MPNRFVLLRHECPPEYEKPSHWDFMLEADGVLKTWELRQLPAVWLQALGAVSQDSPSEAVAIPLPDHRLEYLEIEGPVSGGRGSVVRVERGTYEILSRGDDHLEFILNGAHLQGTFRLKQSDGNWLLA